MFLFTEPVSGRLFLTKQGERQNNGVVRFGGLKTVGHCGFKCIEQAAECVGFNFKPEPPVVCELSSVSHDSPNADMVVDAAWNHYAIR